MSTIALTADQASLEGIHPDRLYTAKEAAAFLGLCETTVYRMGASGVLKRTGVGPRRGRTKYLGRDILQYLNSES